MASQEITTTVPKKQDIEGPAVDTNQEEMKADMANTGSPEKKEPIKVQDEEEVPAPDASAQAVPQNSDAQQQPKPKIIYKYEPPKFY